MHKPGFDVVVVLGTDTPAGTGHRDRHQRKAELSAGQIAQLSRTVDQLVHRVTQERREQQVGNGTQAGSRRTCSRAGDDALGQRGVAHPLAPEGLHQRMSFRRHAFAHQQHARVACHLLGQRLIDRFLNCNLCHFSWLLRRRHR